MALADFLTTIASGSETTTSAALYDFANMDLSAITDSISSALPVVIPVAVGVMGIFVVWRIVKRFIK